MILIQLAGYFASLLIFCTFYMKKMLLPRAVGGGAGVKPVVKKRTHRRS